MGGAAAAFNVIEYTNKDTATTIILGFFGQLQNWWDNHLTYEDRVAILNHTKLDAHSNNIQDAVETLIHSLPYISLAILKKDKPWPNLSLLIGVALLSHTTDGTKMCS